MGKIITNHKDKLKNKAIEKCTFCRKKVKPEIVSSQKVNKRIYKFNVALKYECKCGHSWTGQISTI